MAASRNRPIFALLSVILLAASIYCLASLSMPARFQTTSSYRSLISTIIFSYNIPILTAWAAFGIFGGMAVRIPKTPHPSHILLFLSMSKTIFMI